MATENTSPETPKEADQGTGMDALKAVSGQQDQKEEAAPKLDSMGRAYATGKRKDAVARVWIKRGTGKMTVNKRVANDYFQRPTLQMIIKQPFDITKSLGQYDVVATVKGGGLSGQAGALKHGISKALVNFDPQNRSPLKSNGFLTRDSRVVERKKYGKRKARRSFQFSKR